MKLNNNQLLNFNSRIYLSDSEKQKYKDQIDNLVKELSHAIYENTDSKVLKVIKAGSWKKRTILKPAADTDLDIDLIFFMDTNEQDFKKLNSYIIDFLDKIYTNKTREDFWESEKTSGIYFKSSGLNVDIVPVLQVDYKGNVRQPQRHKRGGYFITNPEMHLEFIQERKKINSGFSTEVRILKKWKNFNNLPISSFAIELLQAYLEINNGIETNIENSIIRFFEFLSRKDFPVISFNAEYGKPQYDGSTIYIADPSNNSNNITRYLKQNEWDEIQEKAQLAFELLIYAQETEENETIELWKEIVSDQFNILPLNN